MSAGCDSIFNLRSLRRPEKLVKGHIVSKGRGLFPFGTQDMVNERSVGSFQLTVRTDVEAVSITACAGKAIVTTSSRGLSKKKSIEVSAAKFMSTLSFCKLGKRGTCLSARRRNMVGEWIVRNCASRVIERTRHEYCSNRAHVSSDMISGSIYKDQDRFGVNVEGDIPIVDCLVREYEERDTEAASFLVSPARGNQALFQRRHGMSAPENRENGRVFYSQGLPGACSISQRSLQMEPSRSAL